MPVRKTREQREAQRAELERQDREHASRLAAYSATSVAKVALFCQQCEGKLKPTAIECHYCGSTDLGPSQPSCPRFSDVSVDGSCPRCHGKSFRTSDITGTATTVGFLAGGVLGAAVGAVAGAMSPNDVIICVTCGARFRPA